MRSPVIISDSMYVMRRLLFNKGEPTNNFVTLGCLGNSFLDSTTAPCTDGVPLTTVHDQKRRSVSSVRANWAGLRNGAQVSYVVSEDNNFTRQVPSFKVGEMS